MLQLLQKRNNLLSSSRFTAKDDVCEKVKYNSMGKTNVNLLVKKTFFLNKQGEVEKSEVIDLSKADSALQAKIDKRQNLLRQKYGIRKH